MARNKVVFGDTTIMDITDTTTTPEDVSEGEIFYDNGGNRQVGTGRWMEPVEDPTANEVLITDANGQAIGSGILIGNVVQFTDIATETELGLIKLNPGQNITLNENNQLEVGGRLGQTEDGGLYSPVSMNPVLVETAALLLSKMSGLQVANGSLALLRGGGVTVKSAPAGTTEYHVSNTYTNRLICAGLQTAGAVCIINEAAEPTGDFSTILSCTINGASFVPHTGADDPDNDIVIVVDKTCNPDSAVTQIRFYQAATKSSSFYAGQMVGGGSGLANVIVGQNVFSPSGNSVVMIAAQSYNTGNGNAIFGRYHNVTKNRWLVSGTGHDTTNGRSEAGAVVGQYSDLGPKTLFAVGNGANQLNRSNAFEINENYTKIDNIVATAKQIIFDGGDYDNLAPMLVADNWGTSADWSFADGVLTFNSVSAARNCNANNTFVSSVSAGETLTVSFEAKKAIADGSIGNLQINLLKTNATGGSATNNIVINKPSSDITTEWATYTATFTVPSGMEYMLPRITKANATVTSGQNYQVRNLLVGRPMNKGAILTSPNGTKYKIVVDDSGNLTTAAV